MKVKSIVSYFVAGGIIFLTIGCSTTNNQQSAAGGETGAVKAVETSEAEGVDFGRRDPASYRASLKFMVHTTAQPEYMIKKFNEIYPNINIELVVVPGAEQQEKIMGAAATGEDVPDLFTSRTQFVKAMVDSDRYYADLSSAPFNAGDWGEQLEPYIVEVGTEDSTGALRALSWQCPVGGIYYRRSMAKDIFGTDDPAEMAKIFGSFDSLIDAARKVRDKTNGTVYFTADAPQDLMFMGITNAGGFIADDKLNTGEEIKALFEYTKIMYDEDLTMGYVSDGTATAAAISEDKVFCTAKPTWGLNYNIMPNFPDQAGDWALTSGPYPYTSGGTWIGISKDTEYPEECYLFLKFILTDEAFIRSYAIDIGDYVSNVAVQQEMEIFMNEEGADLDIVKYLGGQNPYAYWNEELAKGINPEAFSQYDEYFGFYLMDALESYGIGNADFEKALQQYREDCQSYAPNLIVD
ncbi:ABC transporter substrate-binding protein [Lachnospiraceae bacterium 54-53]